MESRIDIIRTQGDRIDDRPFIEIEGKGFFTAELEQALRERRIDIAVHSLKDLPTEMPPDLAIAAVPERADPRDLLLVAEAHHDPKMAPLPLAPGARVGTSSVRRRAQLLNLRPDLAVESLRGNVPTRVRRLREGAHDAILIAQAGVSRLELDLGGLIAVPLDVDVFVPAPGQGALAVQVRAGDDRVVGPVAMLHDAGVAAVVDAERSLLGMFGGGCSLPLGAHILTDPDDSDRHTIMVYHSHDDGTHAVRVRASARDSLALARHAHERIRAASVGPGRNLAGKRVVVTREAADEDPLIAGLEAQGAVVVSFPVLEIVPDSDPDLEASTLAELDAYDWILFPSANAVRQLGERLARARRTLPEGARIGVVGPGTAAALRELGREPDLVPAQAISDALLDAMLSQNGTGRYRVLIPSAREGRTVLADGLATAGHDVVTLPVYRTRATDPSTLDVEALAGADYVLFASPSAVRHFTDVTDVPAGARVVTIGPVTSAEARARSVDVFTEATRHTMEGLIACLTKD